MASGDKTTPPETPRAVEPGTLVRLHPTGHVAETTGRVGRMGDQWMLEIDNEGVRAWWDITFIAPAYEAGQ
jgi:hypothetical protein